MSSAPSGLDVRLHSYGYVNYVIPDGVPHFISTAGGIWRVTRIQFYAAAVNGSLSFERPSLQGQQITIAPNGCVELEPNGAFSGRLVVQGLGSRVIVEYWWPTSVQTTLFGPLVTIT